MWTALPRKADTSRLELDVFVSPRLGVDAPVDRYALADFPEFEHWTKTIDDTPSGRRFYYVNKAGEDGFHPVEEVFA